MHSFRRTKIDATNQILKAECNNLPQTYFMDQEDDWVKSNMISNESFFTKISFTQQRLVMRIFLNQFFYFKSVFYRIKKFTSIIIVIIFMSIRTIIIFAISIITTPTIIISITTIIIIGTTINISITRITSYIFTTINFALVITTVYFIINIRFNPITIINITIIFIITITTI